MLEEDFVSKDEEQEEEEEEDVDEEDWRGDLIVDDDFVEIFRLTKRGQYDVEAIRAFENSVKLNPTNVDLWIQLRDSWIHLHELSRAIEANHQAILLDPDSYQLWFQQGELLFGCDQFYEAVLSFLQSTKYNHTCPETYRWIGDCWYQLHDLKQCLCAMNQALSLDSDNWEYLFRKGTILFEMCEYEQSVECLQICIEINNSRIGAWKLLIESYELLGDLSKAAQLSSTSLSQINYPSAYLYFLNGRLLLKLKDIKKAIQSLEISSKLDPHNSEVWGLLSEACCEDQKNDNAIHAICKAIELDSKNSCLWFNKGTYLQNQLHSSEAAEAFMKSVECDIKNSDAWRQLTFVCIELSDFPKAIVAAENLLSLIPNDTAVLFSLGVAYEAQGQITKGIEMKIKSLKSDPSDQLRWKSLQESCKTIETSLVKQKEIVVQQLYDLAASCRSIRLFNESLKAYSLCLPLTNYNPDTIYSCATVLFESQRYSECLDRCVDLMTLKKRHWHWDLLDAKALYHADYLETALEKFQSLHSTYPQELEILFYLGNVYIDLEMYDSAIAAFEACLKLEPSDSRICFLLYELYCAVENNFLLNRAYNRLLSLSIHYSKCFMDGLRALKLRNTREALEIFKSIDFHESKYDWFVTASDYYVGIIELHLKRFKPVISHLHSNDPSHPTLYEYAIFSEGVYYDDGNKTNLPPEWKLMRTSYNKKTGYFGAAYASSDGALVFAHRGTDISNIESLIADIHLFSRNPPQDMLQSAFKFVRKILSSNQQFRSISHTGHSLGAALAELCAYRLKSKAVTFDSPGIRAILEKLNIDNLEIEQLDVTGYLSEPNLVNIMSPQVGNTFHLVFTDSATTPAASSVLTWTMSALNVGKIAPMIPEIARQVNIQYHPMVWILTAFDKQTHQLLYQPLKVKNWPRSHTQLQDYVDAVSLKLTLLKSILSIHSLKSHEKLCKYYKLIQRSCYEVE